MATLRQRSREAKDEDLLARVQQGMVQVANEVLEEGLPATPSDLVERRHRLAELVIATPGMLVPSMAQNVASHENFGVDPGNPTGNDPATDSETGDGALLYILREKWNDYAMGINR